ncbi:hypothetical protein VM1G_11151 [Cytospora mali]|uniref:HNH nuclease domain-containing protein n=1 Tax=Cytospora mali TaxID=578113 RepID=A0A194VJP0_CYTMA|nr:hypothetical protein VM1G_11151 [Valsa mali]
MSGVTKEQRMQSWNVNFLVGRKCVAGVYQRGNLLNVGQVAKELSLCLTFKVPDATWESALLDTASQRLIVLDFQNQQPLPTPQGNDIKDYSYVFHIATCSKDAHTLTDQCIQRPSLPNKGFDPRYLEIGKQCLDERLSLVPLRRIMAVKRRTTSASPLSRSPSPAKANLSHSPSPTRSDEPIPRTVISVDEARPYINDFRSNVLANQRCCAISGKGKSWVTDGGVGPGIKAAHIIPQLHWNTFPVDDDRAIASLSDISLLKRAWISTWETANGIPMLSHLHKCFNARLISIHPNTHIIRAFVNYDVITDFHGQKAILARNINQQALQHHWDMCCLENTPLWSLPYPPTALGDIPDLGGPSSYSIPQGDPSKARSTQAPDTQVSDSKVTDSQSSLPNLYNASYATAHPFSPPPSEPASGECMRWYGKDQSRADEPSKQGCINEGNIRDSVENEDVPSQPRNRHVVWRQGSRIIEDAGEAQQLQEEGWLLEVIYNEENDRGRSSEKRRCVATEQYTEDDGHVQCRDGGKRQRLDTY